MNSYNSTYIFQQILKCEPGHASSSGMSADLETADEAELLRYLKQGTRSQREQAFTVLYNRYYNDIRWFIQSKVPSKEDAEDVFAKVWVTAFEKLPHFVWEGKPIKSWLLTTARNKALEHFRADVRCISLDDEVLDFLEAKLEPDEPLVIDVDSNAALEANKRVHQLISSLNKREQKVILLKYFNGKSNQEIADVLKTTPGNARIIAHRALEKMRMTQ